MCERANSMTIGAWKDMAPVYTNTCSDSAPGQQWTALADGRIAVAGSSPRTYFPSPFPFTLLSLPPSLLYPLTIRIPSTTLRKL